VAVPAAKAELLAAIDRTFDALMVDLVRTPPGQVDQATLPGHAAGTLMSPADLVAYLIGWNELVLKWLDRDDQGQLVDFPETGFKWNQLGALAGKFYADYRALDWPQRLQRLSAAKTRLVETILARSDAELYGRPWFGKWTKGRMIQLNTAAPYANARGRIRKGLKA